MAESKQRASLDRDAVRRACDELAAFVGHPVEAVVGVQADGDAGGWRVTTQVVEIERLPHSTDVLACYELQLDRGGELLGFRRARRFTRAQLDGGEDS